MIEYEFDERLGQCLICDSPDIIENMVDFRGITVSLCNKCGFQFMNPQYTDRYLSEYYSMYTQGEDFERWHEALLYGHNFYLSLIEKNAAVGKMLDVGCGNGHLLEAAMKRGWSVRGYDVDKKMTQIVSDRLGVEVGSGDFVEGDLGDGYDLITMHQVLEHLKNPNRYLSRIHSMLKSDGVLFVAVPNIKSLSSRIKYSLEKKGFRQETVGKYYDTSHHLLYFEPKSLVMLLEKHGFEVLYERNCHSARPGQSGMKRFIKRNLSEHLFAKSAFLLIARKG